jgi:DNA-binding SARP family transcriptional activator
VVVSRARAQPGADVIASTPTGYRLALTDEQVDASAVLLRAAASARHARAGDHAAALAEAEAGVALWEGPPDGDAGLDDPLAALRAERASTYRSLVRARALALARLGRHAEAAEVLAELVGERPRDEEVLAELLRCEAATVGPSAALDRYEAYRRALRDELGSDPDPRSRPSTGSCSRAPRRSSATASRTSPTPLLGRDDDIAAVASLLRTSRVTSIVGPGGLGKTRLAQAVSRQAEQGVLEHLVDQSLLQVADTRRACGSGCWRRCASSPPANGRRPGRPTVCLVGSWPGTRLRRGPQRRTLRARPRPAPGADAGRARQPRAGAAVRARQGRRRHGCGHVGRARRPLDP